MKAERRGKDLLVNRALAATASLGFVTFLAVRYGLLGAAWGTAVGSLTSLACSRMRRSLGRRQRVSRIRPTHRTTRPRSQTPPRGIRRRRIFVVPTLRYLPSPEERRSNVKIGSTAECVTCSRASHSQRNGRSIDREGAVHRRVVPMRQHGPRQHPGRTRGVLQRRRDPIPVDPGPARPSMWVSASGRRVSGLEADPPVGRRDRRSIRALDDAQRDVLRLHHSPMLLRRSRTTLLQGSELARYVHAMTGGLRGIGPADPGPRDRSIPRRDLRTEPHWAHPRGRSLSHPLGSRRPRRGSLPTSS